MEHLFPKFDVSINADSDYEIAFGRGKYVVDSFFVHIADLVEVSWGQPIQQQFMVLNCINYDVRFCILRKLGPMPYCYWSFLGRFLFLLYLVFKISFSYYFSI